MPLYFESAIINKKQTVIRESIYELQEYDL